jgi:hypothetical protein
MKMTSHVTLRAQALVLFKTRSDETRPNMKYSRIRKWAAVIACICSGGLVPQASALSLTFDDVSFLGELDRGKNGKDKEERYVDQLAGLTLNTTFRGEGITYTRSGNQFDWLPAADLVTSVKHDHTGIVLDGSYDYVLARYGSGETVVWYVGGLTGSYDLPGSGNDDRALHHYSLFQSGNLAPSKGLNVPDAGSALALLCLSLPAITLFASLKSLKFPSLG